MWSKRRGQSTSPVTSAPSVSAPSTMCRSLPGVVVDDVEDGQAGEPAEVERLATRGGIERGLVERHRMTGRGRWRRSPTVQLATTRASKCVR
jgi:hypothetical protein